jgi:hypothetical protein
VNQLIAQPGLLADAVPIQRVARFNEPLEPIHGN